MKTKKKLVYQDRKRETYLHLEIEMSVSISSERSVSLTFDNEADEAWRVPVALGLEYVLERMPKGGAYQGLSARVFMVDARQLDFARYRIPLVYLVVTCANDALNLHLDPIPRFEEGEFVFPW
jgi:hypothetical protein